LAESELVGRDDLGTPKPDPPGISGQNPSQSPDRALDSQGNPAQTISPPVRSPAVKKGRHRRFEEARKLKQAGPSAFDLGLGGTERRPRTEEDEYAALAEKYGVVFDDDDEADDDIDELNDEIDSEGEASQGSDNDQAADASAE